MDDCSGCEEKPGRTARRKRMEVRRFKLIAKASGSAVEESSSDDNNNNNIIDNNKRVKMAAANGSTTTTAAHCHTAPNSENAVGGFPSGDGGVLIEAQESERFEGNVSDGCPPHGAVSVCGRRREMEDAVAVVPAFAHGDSDVYHLFGVFDGHGGSQAALYCKDQLPLVLAEEVRSIDPETEVGWRNAMSTCFWKMDTGVEGLCCVNECKEVSRSSGCVEEKATGTVGSTAAVAVVGSTQIIVANCGDSRVVLSTAGRAIPLSTDHKPDRADEMARIEAAGGRVIFWNGYRVLGVLAMSRAIGDRYLKPYVIAEPELTFTQRTDEDECLIVASDGLWDVLSNEVACDVARKCLGFGVGNKPKACSRSGPEVDSPAAAAAALLTKLALARGSPDNISVVVVDLKSPRRGDLS